MTDDIVENILKERYYQPGETCWEDIVDRVSGALFDKNDEQDDYILCKKYLNKKRFIFNSPTLMNLGTKMGQGSACFVLPIKDDMSDIYDTIRKSALIFQSGGGVGINWSTIRPEGSLVKTTNGTASGPLAFMHSFDAMVETVKSSGKRRGAAIAILNDNHPDIFKFVTSKNKEGQLSNFNISVLLTDKFMKEVELDGYWKLSFQEEYYRTVKARDLFYEICKAAWTRAEPGVLFYNTINKDNPMKSEFGDIVTCNPCVTGDTFITVKTNKGIEYLPIQKFVGHTVSIWNGFEWSIVKPKITGYDRELLDISVELTINNDNFTSSVKCTTYHMWILENDIRIMASNLQIGDILKSWFDPNGNIVSGKIVDIQPYVHNEQEVYCFTEYKNHSGVFNGILTANCGEQPLCVDYNTGGGEACVLGSIDISKYITYYNNEPCYDNLALEDTVRFAVRALDRVVDVNKYPLPEIKECVLKGRKIGLGIMGFADALIKFRIVYGSKESIEFIDEIMSLIHDISNSESRIIGNGKQKNACILTCAPTGTLSLFADCSSGIEPNFGWVYNRSTWVNGEKKTYKMIHPLFELFVKDKKYYDEIINYTLEHGTVRGCPHLDKYEINIYCVAKDIEPLTHVAVQAAFQKYIDSSISKTIVCPNSTTVEDIYNIYMEAWKSGCKGLTIYREGSRQDVVLETNASKKGNLENIELTNPVQYKLVTAKNGRILPKTPRIMNATVNKRKTACGKLYVIPAEAYDSLHSLFLINKGGCDAMTQAIAELIGSMLRFGIPRWEITRICSSVVCQACRNRREYVDGKSCADIIAQVILELYPDEEEPPKHEEPERQHTDQLPPKGIQEKIKCPKCGEGLIFMEGCVTCKSCGFSRCG